MTVAIPSEPGSMMLAIGSGGAPSIPHAGRGRDVRAVSSWDEVASRRAVGRGVIDAVGRSSSVIKHQGS
jgi:hypothetical protein